MYGFFLNLTNIKLVNLILKSSYNFDYLFYFIFYYYLFKNICNYITTNKILILN